MRKYNFIFILAVAVLATGCSNTEYKISNNYEVCYENSVRMRNELSLEYNRLSGVVSNTQYSYYLENIESLDMIIYKRLDEATSCTIIASIINERSKR